MMVIDTRNLSQNEWVNTMPGEACTEIGADPENPPKRGEGAAIAALLVAVGSVAACIIFGYIMSELFK